MTNSEWAVGRIYVPRTDEHIEIDSNIAKALGISDYMLGSQQTRTELMREAFDFHAKPSKE